MLAFEVVAVLNAGVTAGQAVVDLSLGIAFAMAIGIAAGWLIVRAFRRGWVPEYMKVPVLFVSVLAAFAASDALLHESGLLAVTIMGVWIADADLPSYEELRRFKEHATVLLVSGVFILLAAGLDFSELARLDWRAVAFVLAVVLIARPLTVLVSLIGTALPWKERAFIAFTGPRGVVLVAVAGLFGDRLAEIGVADGALVGPLAFVLVATTVVFHGFTLRPIAKAFGSTAGHSSRRRQPLNHGLCRGAPQDESAGASDRSELVAPARGPRGGPADLPRRYPLGSGREPSGIAGFRGDRRGNRQ